MKSLAVAILLLAPLVAGCIGDDGPTNPLDGDKKAISKSLWLPDGATLVEKPGALVASWVDAPLPFVQSFSVPEGATMARFVADPGETATVSVSMSHDDTGRRRCNQQSVVGFGQALTGERSCSSIAFIDPPGTNWTARASGSGIANVSIEYHYGPLDGPAANVDWSQLSHATYDLQQTVGQYITAHDGARLWVEVTLPIGEGPWPTVIAASPYNLQTGRIPDPGEGGTASGTPAMWTYWTQDYAKRGYAAVNIDVRGFGKSGGCVEVWGINEQYDQKLIVDWVADQPWSNGAAGFYGQSYVATTPVAAAVQTPDALKAIIAVAPVIDSYFDWHYGGVPNGESALSPVAYQALVDTAGTGYAQEIADDPTNVGPTDLTNLLQYSTSGLCDPTLIPLANDPRAIHSGFYDVRDFGARAGDVTAAVLYTQGFEDANVKSAMIPDWFNDINAPKLGVFGHWLHQHPARMDAEVLFLGWMDEFVKGKPLGIADAYPDALISVDGETERLDDSWPPADLETTQLFLDFTDNVLDPMGGRGTHELDMFPVVDVPNANPLVSNTLARLDYELEAGQPIVEPKLTMQLSLSGENAMIYAQLNEIRADGTSRLLTWGMKNLALRPDYDTYTPILPDFQFTDVLPFRPTELIAEEGSTIRLTLRAVQAGESTGTAQPQPGTLTLYGEGTSLDLHGLTMADYHPIPITALP